MISPNEYAYEYLNMSVPLGAGKSATVAVKDYQNPGTTNSKNSRKVIPSSYWSNVVWVKFKEHVKSSGNLIYGAAIPAGVDHRSVQRVYSGYGSPDEIRTMLQLVHLYWKELKGDVGTSAPDLQMYIDRYIGLYCTGFVGNYTTHILGALGKGPDTSIGLFAPNGFRRRDVKSVEVRDVLVWVSGIHIALIHSVEGGDANFACLAAESSWDTAYRGLTPAINKNTSAWNRYALIGVKGTVFTFKRGLNSSYQTADVYIASPYVVPT